MKLDKRRRQEFKTDYRRRLILLKGKLPRFVVRKTNKYIIAQIIESNHAQDKILFMANSKELLKLGVPKDKEGSLKSLPAAYLTGYLIGKKAKAIKTGVNLDIGLYPSTKGSRIYATCKGLKDAGIKISFDEKIVPPKELLEGKSSKIDSNLFNKVKGAIK